MTLKTETHQRNAIGVSEHAFAAIIHGKVIQKTQDDGSLLFVINQRNEFGKETRLHYLGSTNSKWKLKHSEHLLD